MLGIPGTGYLESFIPGKALGQFDQIASLLGLDSGNAPVVLMLGSVKFSLNTAAIRDGYRRMAQAKWASVSRIGGRDDLQFTGPGSDTLEIPCVIYGHWKQKNETLDALHDMLNAGLYYNLIDAVGTVLGVYTITQIDSQYSWFTEDAKPRHTEFTIYLRKYADVHNNTKNTGGRGLLGRVFDAIVK